MDGERFTRLLQDALSDPDVANDLRRRNAGVAELIEPVRAREQEILTDAAKEIAVELAAEREAVSAQLARDEVHQEFATWVARGVPQNIVARTVSQELLRTDSKDVLRAKTLDAVRTCVVADDPTRRLEGPLELARVLPAIGLTLLIVFAERALTILTLQEFLGVAVLGGVALAGTGYLGDLLVILLLQRNVVRRIGYGDDYVLKLDAQLTDAEVRLRDRIAETDKVIRHRLIFELRAVINQMADESRSSILPAERPFGLAEVFDPRHEVRTDARDELTRHLCNMPGGAIGVAGSRGAGKSTLLRSVTERVPQLTVGGVVRPVLGVFTTAPVQYDGREFLLHLFARTCSRVLGDSRTVPQSNPQPQVPPAPAWLSYLPLFREIGSFAVVVAGAVGTVLFALGIAAAFWAAAAATLEVLQVKGGAAIGTGFIAIFTSLMGARALSFLTDHAEIELARRPQPATASVPPKPLGFTGDDESWGALIRSATDWLAEIRFQRSYSHGWSGALKLPIGAEASINQAVSWSQRQLSLPELAKAYTEFIQQVTAHFVVIVAIDELDKMGSEQKVQEFLNEVKAVFGIERCFYLLSISDHAMSSFARRGLPIRDAFDSALDEVVRVPYMKHEAARDLLSQRTIRLPWPYVSFCYCLSGGLPRDVIRACRDVFDTAERTGSRELRDVIRGVIRDDLNHKIDATITVATQSSDADGGTGVLQRLVALGTISAEIPELLNEYSDLVDAAAAVESRVLRSLVMDLAAYYLYAVTLIETFDGASGEGWDQASQNNRFADLAGLRRRLEIDSDAARRDLVLLRAKHSMNSVRAEAVKPRRVQPRGYFHLSAREKPAATV